MARKKDSPARRELQRNVNIDNQWYGPDHAEKTLPDGLDEQEYQHLFEPDAARSQFDYQLPPVPGSGQTVAYTPEEGVDPRNVSSGTFGVGPGPLTDSSLATSLQIGEDQRDGTLADVPQVGDDEGNLVDAEPVDPPEPVEEDSDGAEK